jgi:hypothetical protein
MWRERREAKFTYADASNADIRSAEYIREAIGVPNSGPEMVSSTKG